MIAESNLIDLEIALIVALVPVVTWWLQVRTQRHNKRDHGNVVAELQAVKSGQTELKAGQDEFKAEIREIKADVRDVKHDMRLVKAAQVAVNSANSEIDEAYAAAHEAMQREDTTVDL